MRTREIQLGDGIAYRIDLQPYRGRLYLMLLFGGILMVALFPWKWGLANGPLAANRFELTGAAAILTLFCIAGAFSNNLIQLDPNRRIRKGWRLLGVPIWLGNVPISRMTDLLLDSSDRDNLALKCLDASGNSILCIEGFRNHGEAEQLARHISSQFVDRELAIRHFVKDVAATPAASVRTSLRWGIALAALLCAAAFAFIDPATTFKSRFVSTVIAMFLAGMGFLIVLPDEQRTNANADEGIIRGWYRHRFFWICSYVWDLNANPDPMVTDRRIDKRIPILGFILLAFGVLVFLYPTIKPDRATAKPGHESGMPEFTDQQREAIRTGSERMREMLEKRKRDYSEK